MKINIFSDYHGCVVFLKIKNCSYYELFFIEILCGHRNMMVG